MLDARKHGAVRVAGTKPADRQPSLRTRSRNPPTPFPHFSHFSILCEKLLVISWRFFGIPPFRF